MPSDFNLWKDHYSELVRRSTSFAGQGIDFFTELKAQCILDIARAHFGNTQNLNILDVGCGIGLTDRFLAPHFGKIYGLDTADGMVEKASIMNPSVDYRVYDGQQFPFAEDTFDLVFAICVMHHISPPLWENFIHQMHRAVKSGGLVLVFEHNPFNPATRLAVHRCEFDEDAILIKRDLLGKIFLECGLELVERSYILFFPFRGWALRFLEKGLKWLPLGAQYLIAGKKGS